VTTEAYVYDAIRTPRGRGKATGSLNDGSGHPNMHGTS